MYLVRTPALLRWIYADLLWRVPSREKVIYLTFDDGVTPELTAFIVAELDKYGAKATFFLVGEQSAKYPELVDLLRAKGHNIGNHTQRHENGWRTGLADYCASVAACDAIVGSRLFRPPYGRISRRQIRALKGKYKIVMWDVLAGDFDPNVSGEACLARLKRYAAAGSIVVLHDNAKFADKVRYILPKLLEFYAAAGYRLEALQA